MLSFIEENFDSPAKSGLNSLIFSQALCGPVLKSDHEGCRKNFTTHGDKHRGFQGQCSVLLRLNLLHNPNEWSLMDFLSMLDQEWKWRLN